MSHERNTSESEIAFTNPQKTKQKPHAISIPPFLTSCFAPDTSEDLPSYRPPMTCRADSRPKSRFGRRRHHSADFRYDALSYSLNFDDGSSGDDSQQAEITRNFSSRLPATPPKNFGRKRP